jgi:hypothetical protein
MMAAEGMNNKRMLRISLLPESQLINFFLSNDGSWYKYKWTEIPIKSKINLSGLQYINQGKGT